jgi:hypothetical protein
MVCIAGYDKDRTCIRPILPPPGIPESRLFGSDGKPIIFPFAIVEFGTLEASPQPPHTEDSYFFSISARFIRHARDRQKVLEWTLTPPCASYF